MENVMMHASGKHVAWIAKKSSSEMLLGCSCALSSHLAGYVKLTDFGLSKFVIGQSIAPDDLLCPAHTAL
eukprot:2123177-Amphidinium_carterae.2